VIPRSAVHVGERLILAAPWIAELREQPGHRSAVFIIVALTSEAEGAPVVAWLRGETPLVSPDPRGRCKHCGAVDAVRPPGPLGRCAYCRWAEAEDAGRSGAP